MNKCLFLSAPIAACWLLLQLSTVHAWVISAPTSLIIMPRSRIASLATTTPSFTTRTSSQLQATSSSNTNRDQDDPLALARLRLEMHWNLEQAKESQECIVEDPSTCDADECPDCNGEGETTCRFCRGTMQMYVGSMDNHRHGYSDTPTAGGFQSCPVCQEGHEVCHSCRGTGWIADWTRPPPSQQQQQKQQDDEEELHGRSHGGGSSLKP